MVLPYKEIKEIVEYERERFLAAVSEPERGQLRWEHVGSTSIEGMPGTKFPDALLIIPEFPPSKPIIQGFLDCGYYFSRASPLDARDLWFFYIFEVRLNTEELWISRSMLLLDRLFFLICRLIQSYIVIQKSE